MTRLRRTTDEAISDFATAVANNDGIGWRRAAADVASAASPEGGAADERRAENERHLNLLQRRPNLDPFQLVRGE